ncbi:hypothetical protein CEXT_241021 [Caerostris extrusa]|uniref:Uncharacterized protein n=1 Tax=Caerostris extrusa TaxID=172846 RepID=A0AAV4PV19_CAEEX|nr:hypothetical protein CEXT_241021 [Caerostris extrusa]
MLPGESTAAVYPDAESRLTRGSSVQSDIESNLWPPRIHNSNENGENANPSHVWMTPREMGCYKQMKEDTKTPPSPGNSTVKSNGLSCVVERQSRFDLLPGESLQQFIQRRIRLTRGSSVPFRCRNEFQFRIKATKRSNTDNSDSDIVMLIIDTVKSASQVNIDCKRSKNGDWSSIPLCNSRHTMANHTHLVYSGVGMINPLIEILSLLLKKNDPVLQNAVAISMLTIVYLR